MDERDAEAKGLGDVGEMDRLAVDENFTGGGRIDAGNDPHQGALAGAVFADDGEHFASAEGQRDVVEGADAGELLTDMADFQQRRRGGERHGRVDGKREWVRR